MKKILFLFFVLFSHYSFSYLSVPADTSSCYSLVVVGYTSKAECDAAIAPYLSQITHIKDYKVGGAWPTFACHAEYFKCSISSSTSSSSSSSSSSKSSSSSSSVISCPAPLISNTVLQNGEWVTSCIEKPDSNNSGSSSLPSLLQCKSDELKLQNDDGTFSCYTQIKNNSSAASSATGSAAAASAAASGSNSSFPSPEIKTAWESCQLTFVGADCTAVASTSPCPQSVTIAGQKFCVSKRFAVNSSASGSASGGGSGSGSGAGSGTGTSAPSNEAGDCDPTSVDYFKCMTPEGGDMPDHTETESGLKTVGDVNKNFKDRLGKSPVVTSLGSIKNIISLSSSNCPDFSVTLFGRDVSTTIHCSMWALVAVVLSPLMIAFWSIIAFRIFASS